MTLSSRGLMLILSSPSGAGKTTLSRRLVKDDPRLTLSVSATTRPPRPAEKEGRDYFFVTPERFAQMRKHRELLEWAEVLGHAYGTPRAAVEQTLDEGRDVLFDIDWQGAQQLTAARPGDVVTVFVLPPSAQALRERLAKRRQDSAPVRRRRLAHAPGEITRFAEYDYILVNDEIEGSLAALQAILRAERLRRRRRQGLTQFVERLRKDLEAAGS